MIAVFLSLKVVLILAYSEVPDEMQHYNLIFINQNYCQAI